MIAGQRSGTVWTIVRFVQLTNTAEDQRRHFCFDAVEFARAVGHCERDGLAFLGFVHSHPNGPPTPSETDRAEAWRGCVHGIVATDEGAPTAVAFYSRADDNMEPLPSSIDEMEFSA